MQSTLHLIETHIRPCLSKYPIDKISTQLIESFVEGKLSSGRIDKKGGLSPKTVTDILILLKGSIEYAKYNHLPMICDLSKLSVKYQEKEIRVFEIKTLSEILGHSNVNITSNRYVHSSFELKYDNMNKLTLHY